MMLQPEELNITAILLWQWPNCMFLPDVVLYHNMLKSYSFYYLSQNFSVYQLGCKGAWFDSMYELRKLS